MPSPDATLVFLEIDGGIFDFWTHYSCSSSLFEADSPFEFEAPIISDRSLRELNGNRIAPGKVVQVFVRTPSNRPKAVLQYTGIIKTVEYAATRDGGGVLKVGGRNHLAPIVDSDAMPGFSPENTTFAELIYKMLTVPPPGASFAYFSKAQIIVDNDANRALLTGNPAAGKPLSKKAVALETLKVDQARPHAGESIFHFLQRHATRMGLMIWGTADGKIVFGRPNYDQQPLYNLELRIGQGRADTNNALAFSSRVSFEHRASEIHVYGHSKGGDDMRSPIHAVVYDDEVRNAGLFRPITVHDNNARTIEQAEQRARMELSKQLQSANVITAMVEGHGANNSVWSIDTCVAVTCDALGLVNDPRYVTSRTFSRSRAGGTTTQLHIMPKNSIVLGSVQYIPPPPPPAKNHDAFQAKIAKEPPMQVIAKMSGSPTPLAYRDEFIASIFPK